MLVFVLLSLPCLQSSRGGNCRIANAFLITNPAGKQTQESFVSIQQAINEAEEQSKIHVPPGIYYENLIVNKTVTLVGADNITSIIDGGSINTVMEITASGVTVRGFKLQNSGYGWNRNGVYVHHVDNCTISSNYFYNVCHNIKVGFSSGTRILDNVINGTMIAPTMYGIRIENSTNCVATGNNVSDCVGSIHLQNVTNCIISQNYLHENSQGIRMYSPCTYSAISANTVFNNTYDGMIDDTMNGNSTFFANVLTHNNFVNNTYPFICKGRGNAWDSGYPSGGNYWSRHNNTDVYTGRFQNESGSDGISDFQYAIDSDDIDRYPLAYSWSSLYVHNINTGSGFNTIQEAIDSSETLDGHTLWVSSNTYFENVNIHKSLTLIGENPATTIIDANRTGTVLLINANDTTLIGFTIQNSGLNYPPYGNDCGIFLDHSCRTNLSNNLITDNRIGVYLFFSNNNLVEDNEVWSNRENGVLLWYSGNNTLTRNNMADDVHNFGVYGDSLADFNNRVDTSNTVDGKRVHYVIGEQHGVFENNPEIGTLYLINCFNATIRNLNLANNVHGVFGFNLTESRIEDITATNNSYGICLQESSDNSVDGGHGTDNWVGLYLQDSNNNNVENTVVDGGEKGVSLYGANYNKISGNTIRNALFGIRLFYSSNNEFNRNNFIQNSEQVSLLTASYGNTWNNSLEGNYWSDYVGPDNNRDGIGDFPRIISSNSNDHCPLLGIFHRLTVQSADVSVEVVTNSTLQDLVYEATKNQIRLVISGSNESYGFCRIRIPHALMEPDITVTIDEGTTQVFYANYSVHDDGFCRWIYFEYQHSQHEIVVVSETLSLKLFTILTCASLLWLTTKKLRLKR